MIVVVLILIVVCCDHRGLYLSRITNQHYYHGHFSDILTVCCGVLKVFRMWMGAKKSSM